MTRNEQGFAPILMIGIITAVLVGGTGTVIVSNGSKPGDVLYGLDRAAESVQLALSFTDDGKKEVHTAVALERLEELKALYADSKSKADDIAEAHDNYEEHKAVLAELSDDDGAVDKHEQELKNRLKLNKTDLDDVARIEQKTLETERETAKKQYEAAVKSGDTQGAAKLNTQISSYEDKLNIVEQQREVEKEQGEDAGQQAEKQTPENTQPEPESSSSEIER